MRRLVFLTMLALLLTSTFASSSSLRAASAEHRTWTVDADGLADFDTIQEAINNADEGDTIFVSSGTYYENVIVNKTVSLVGEDSDTTLIDGNMTDHVVSITKDHVNVTGFTIQRSGGEGALIKAGIYLSSASHCNIFGNRLVDNYVGIFGSPRNTSMSNNTVTNNHVGVDIHNQATYNIISGNCLMANNVSIHVYDANSNSIFENNMTNNQRSITLGYSRNNRFYHNNFFNNAEQIAILASWYANSWDDSYPSGGNFWSDYTGVDANLDGIGDDPYIINDDNMDNYPLMEPWILVIKQTDLNGDGAVNIIDISIVAKAFGSRPEDPNWNEIADLDNNEMVNILDISMVAKDYGKTA